MAKNYTVLADSIVELVGGKDNIRFFTHCITRLRFNVKDKGAVDVKAIEKLPGAIGVQWSGDQLQVIIGQDVGDVYALICSRNDLEKISEGTDKNKAGEKPAKKKNILMAMVDAMSGCIVPLLPILIGGGMLKVVALVLIQLHIVPSDNPTIVTLNFAADAAYYFLPIMIGATGAKKFGANMGIGMMLGGILLHPTFISMVSNGDAGSIFMLPIAANKYGSTVFPMVLTMFICGYVERFIAKHSPVSLRAIVEPLGTLLVMVPLMLCAIAPLGSFLGTYFAAGVVAIYNTIGCVGIGIISAVFPLMVMTGMHTAMLPYSTAALASLGYEPIMGISKMLANVDQGAACLAVAVRTKNKELRSVALSSAVTAMVGGVTEPALYGVNFKYRKPLYAAMAGSFIGGLYGGLMGVARYSMASSSLLTLPQFMGEDPMNMINALIAIAIGMVSTFVICIVICKPSDFEEN